MFRIELLGGHQRHRHDPKQPPSLLPRDFPVSFPQVHWYRQLELFCTRDFRNDRGAVRLFVPANHGRIRPGQASNHHHLCCLHCGSCWKKATASGEISHHGILTHLIKPNRKSRLAPCFKRQPCCTLLCTSDLRSLTPREAHRLEELWVSYGFTFTLLDGMSIFHW